jgi:hypothetical protein
MQVAALPLRQGEEKAALEQAIVDMEALGVPVAGGQESTVR